MAIDILVAEAVAIAFDLTAKPLKPLNCGL
jgi:hypothetical protein